MPAYIIIVQEQIIDQDELDIYAKGAPAASEGHNIVPLILHAAPKVIEGGPVQTVTMLQFDDVAAAEAWYESPQYQAILQHRLRGAKYHSFIVPGFGA